MKKIAEDVYIAEGARVVGDVTIGKNSSVWYNAVIRGDSNSVVIGENTNIQDNAVLHTSHGCGVKIGNHVTIGHGALVTQNKVAPEGSLVLGNPAKVMREISDEEKKAILENADDYSREAECYLRGEIS